MPAFSLKLNKNVISIILLAVAIFSCGLLIMHKAAPAHRDEIATGFLFDLLITFPVCYYFIIVRPLKKSGRGMLLVLTLCYGVAYLVLPAHQRQMILQVRKLTALAELLFIVYAITKIKKIRAAYKIEQLAVADPLFNLRNSMCQVFGDILLVKVLASELAVLRYGLFFWKREKTVSKSTVTFSTHRESGYVAIWCILLLAVLVEIVAFHFLLMRWSKTVAIIVTVLSAYGIVFFIADLSAIIKRQVLIDGETITLRTGLRWRAIVQKNNIASVTKITGDYHTDEIYLKGSAIKTGANVLIKFKSPVMVEKLYGPAMEFSSILMSIDNVLGFIKELALAGQASLLKF